MRRAIQPAVVSAKEKCITTSSDRQTRIMVANDTWRSNQPKLRVASSPPAADAVVSMP